MAEAVPIALRMERVAKSYGRVSALNGLSLEVPRGCFFVLFGPSAVGKTTALRTIAGLVTPDSGSVWLQGRDVTAAPIKERGVSMVFQSFALYPHLTVYENFAYPLREARVSNGEIDTRVRETAAMLKLTHRLERKPNTLSGGEQQRVALGRSLIRRPSILLLDEPLTNLDAKLRHDMRAELKRLHRQFGMTIVYATPDELEALSMGDQIAVMRDGAVVQHGSPDDLYDQPANLYVAGKIGSPTINLVPATVDDGASALSTPVGMLPLAGRSGRAGEKAVVGIRPNDIRIAWGDEKALMSRVHLVEPLGDVTIVSFETAGQTLRGVMPEQAALDLAPGVSVPIAFDASKIQVFRESDGLAMR